MVRAMLSRGAILLLSIGVVWGCSSSGGEGVDDPAVDAGSRADAEPELPVGTYYVSPLKDGQVGIGTEEDPYRQLQVAIDSSGSGSTLILTPGLHYATAREFTETTCGNCDDANFRGAIEATVGFHVRGKALTIRGQSREETILYTGAGYGVLFEDASDSLVETLTITGGVRDGDGRATDAAIVVRRSLVKIVEVDIIGNNDLYSGDPDPVVGIAGVAVREGSDVTIRKSRILNSSWDGIAVYRGDPNVVGSGPVVHVEGNLIGCTRQCTSRSGRGVGIGVTWDATATIRNNEVFEYWKGIGAFGSTNVTVQNNLVRDCSAWGVIVTGNAHMEAEKQPGLAQRNDRYGGLERGR